MKCSNQISHRPYVPLNHPEDRERPHVCRLAPNANGFFFAWLDHNDDGEHRVVCRLRGTDTVICDRVAACEDRIDGLETDAEYEFYIESSKGIRSKTRLVRPHPIPEGATVINYLHPEDPAFLFSGKFLCSPSIVRLKDGALLAGMDVHGYNMGQNLTMIYRSEDNGKNWTYLCDIYPFVWGCLFSHRDKIYLLGQSTAYGNLQISCSEDQGESWSAPTTLVYGAGVLCDIGSVHRAPMHIVPYQGRLYTTCEYGNWTIKSHLPALLSIDEDADLMDPKSWELTDFLPYEGKWKEETETQGDTMEGNIVLAPDGRLYNYLRWKVGEAIRLLIDPSDPAKTPQFDRAIKMPVSNSMFRIFPYRDGYLMVTNRKTEAAAQFKYWSFRSVLSVFFSKNLENWQLLTDIVNYENMDTAKHGFQYPAVLLEEDGIRTVVRSAFGGANSAHDSNYSLFWHIPSERLQPN